MHWRKGGGRREDAKAWGSRVCAVDVEHGARRRQRLPAFAATFLYLFPPDLFLFLKCRHGVEFLCVGFVQGALLTITSPTLEKAG